MGKKKEILLGFAVLLAMAALGQCPVRDSLWRRLVYLRDSAEINPAEHLKELLGYDARMKNCSYQFDSTHVLLEQRIGVMYHYQAEYLKAEHYIKKAISINTSGQRSSSLNLKHLIRLYFNLSVVCDSLNKRAEMMDAIDSCIAIAIRTKSVDEYSLFPLSKRIEYLLDVGDFQRGLSYIVIGETIIQQQVHGRDSIEYLLKFLAWKVTAMISAKKFNVAEMLLANKIEECRKIGATQYLGTLYGQLAIVFSEKKMYDKAQAYFRQAFDWHQKSGYSLGCLQTLTNLGYYIYFQQSHNSIKAKSTYRKALNYALHGQRGNKEFAIEALNIYANIANVFVRENNYDSAQHYFQLAFDQIKPGANEYHLLHIGLNEFVQNKKIGILIGLLTDKANSYLNQYKHTGQILAIKEAIRIYKITDQLLTRMKAEHSELQSKLVWRKISRKLYEYAIEASYEYNNIADAFYFFEKSRAVLLNDQLIEQRILRGQDLHKVAQLRVKVINAEREANSPHSDPEIQKEKFSSQLELNQLLKSIKASNPQYYQNFLDTSFLTIPEVQTQILKSHQALMEIFTGENAVFTLTITAKHVRLARIDKLAFDSTTYLFNSYIANSSLLNREFDRFLNISHQLYLLLFQNNPLPPGRIIISPDKNFFPIEALVYTVKPLRYMLNDYAVSYTYSARFLMNQFENHSTQRSQGLLGMAPIKYPKARGLASLSGSDQSLKRIAKNFKGADIFLEKDASKGNFMQHFARYKVLQLYTHASDSSSTGEPVIYLADSALYLSDLISDTWPITSLVVLSACESGLGRLYEGEGVFSFSRGFAAMGIPASLTNLWDVESESTYRLTELFYKYLASGMPYDVALQKAKLEFFHVSSGEQKLPTFWAASILAGRTDDPLIVVISRGNFYMYSLIVAVLLLGGSIWYLRKRNLRGKIVTINGI
jgi:CHAT domain-containing protein